MSLKTEIEQLQDFYEAAMAKSKEWGLDLYDIDFHVVPAHKIYEMASYGVPGHFNHWTYGRDYWISKTVYDHGLSRIYELIINQDPCQAFLLDTNSLIDNIFTIAHCCGHSCFFKTNNYFKQSNRNISITTAAAAERIREYEVQYGRHEVESFIDDVFTIKEHISPHLNIKKTPEDYELAIPTDKYIDLFPDRQEEERMLLEGYEMAKEQFPPEPDRDIMGFIAAYAPKLKDWQRDIMWSIREEMQYFLPQMRTKIANEGFASIMHHYLMHELDPEQDPGGIDFADINSSVLNESPGQLNPYWLGYNLLVHIMELEDEKADIDKSEWARPNGPGWKKMLEVIELESDESLLSNYIDEKFVEKLNLFSYGYIPEDRTWVVEEKEDWEKVRDVLVQSKANMGMPYIEVVDADSEFKGHLLLEHKYDGRPLDPKWAAGTLKSIRRLWGKEVTLRSQDQDGIVFFKCIDADEPAIFENAQGQLKII